MIEHEEDILDFTNMALESLYMVVDDPRFRSSEAAGLIYDQLEKNMQTIPFGEYLRRYVYFKAGMRGNYQDIPLNEYRIIIRDAFLDSGTPASFSPTTAKLSALIKNWLTQQTVARKVVFLLGFGLRMSVQDVNAFLVKALHEPEINFKNPFEVLCWYCYREKYGYAQFERLWNWYLETPANAPDVALLYSEKTAVVRSTFFGIHDDAELIAMLARLKDEKNLARFSVTARLYFDYLYAETRELIAGEYNRLLDGRKAVSARDISESDIERVMYEAVPLDRHGNLTPAKASRLYARFSGKRFSRQHLHEILIRNVEIDRFDLITLNFFIYSHKTEEIPNTNRRYLRFLDSTNEILESCSMGKLYIANPYECFLLMCILSDDPIGTYTEVWELSYQPEEK